MGFNVLLGQEDAPTSGMAPVADVALRFNVVLCIARWMTPAALDEYTRTLSPLTLSIRCSVIEETIRELIV